MSETMQWTVADVEAAEGVLGRAVPGEATHIVTLTDEQLMALDGVQHDQVVPMPWLDEQGAIDRELVAKVAVRALLSQGYVVPAQRPDGEIGIQAVPDITGPLVLRRTPQAVLSAERTTSVGKHWVFCYVHDDRAVLEEEIASSGHHSFTVYPLEHMGERIVAFVDPGSVAVMAGTPRTMTPEEFTAQAPAIPALTSALAVTTLTAVRTGSTVMQGATVYTGADIVHVLRGSEIDPDGTPASVMLAEAGKRTLMKLPAEMVAAR